MENLPVNSPVEVSLGEEPVQNVKKCRRRRCRRLGAGMLVVNEVQENKDIGSFLPLKEVNVKVVIHDSISTIQMTQIYENPSSEAP